MKKNKTLAYALAATILVGGTFAGTKAWFTNQDTLNNDLIITTGTVDVKAIDHGWLLSNEDTEARPVDRSGDGTNFTFENVKPGDKMHRYIEVTNTGSLAQKIDIEGGAMNKVNSPFNVLTNIDIIDGETLQPGEYKSLEVFVEIPESWDGQDMKFNLDDYMTDIVINAEQTPTGRK